VADRQIDASILEACRRGDRDAFRALYEAYKDNVYSICLYFFHGNAAEAADVTQEVFLKLFGNIASFRGESGFSTWLYRLVQNACLDTARRNAVRARSLPFGSSTVPSHEREFLGGMDAKAVQAAVSSLPPAYRVPILLRYFTDLSYEEIAESQKCSMGTVASRLNRAHRMLAQILKPLRDRVLTGGRNV
jgi:RNA polymerase sigma-70 factor (ECF subfamily)